jgi:hypothetical protein
VFRRRYPEGVNPVATADTRRPFERKFGDLRVRFVGLEALSGWTGERM